jgi:uncharacterized protein
MNQVIFHAAFAVADLKRTKEYYVCGLGCKAGRETAASIILDFYGNQLVAHVTKDKLEPQGSIYPRHFGLIFTAEQDWENLEARVRKLGLRFYEEPKARFVGKATEHRTMFLEDPFYNLLEFKFYRHPSAIFGNREISEIGDQE